jgi:hypothetical protein
MDNRISFQARSHNQTHIRLQMLAAPLELQALAQAPHPVLQAAHFAQEAELLAVHT